MLFNVSAYDNSCRNLQLQPVLSLQVGTALQVFHNLGILVPSVEKVLDSLIARLNNSVAHTLDVHALIQMNQDTKKGKLMFV